VRRVRREAIPPLLSLLLALGCAAAVPPAAAPPALPACAGDPASVLACVRAREDAVHSLRARFRATTHRDDTRQRTNGILLVAKPDRFRLRLMLPLGLTVFDYTRSGERTAMALPLGGGEAWDGEAPPFDGADLDAAFLRGEHAFPGSCQAARAGEEVVVSCADGAVRRELRLDPARGAIVRENSGGADGVRTTIDYDDFRPTASALLPYRIVLAYPARAVTLLIEIDGYEVDPQLAPALFLPAAE
jgi:hypothetical protein